MNLSDRLFEPPARDVAKIDARQARLPPRLRRWIQDAGDALAQHDVRNAQAALSRLLAHAPGQADVLRLYGLLLAQLGNLEGAMANFETALHAAPDDAMGYWQYARACTEAGDVDKALHLRQRAAVRLPNSPLAWADLGEHLFTHQDVAAALAPLERSVELAPDYAPGLFKLGSAYVACGRINEGAVKIRQALAKEPAFGAAWMGLVDLKTVTVTEDEIDQMRCLLESSSRIDAGERTAISFALASAYERTGKYAQAWQLLTEANARRKCELPPWQEHDFLERERRAEEAFACEVASAPDLTQGREVIFVVGMPRSGTTLVEQVLAAHPQVRGAGELTALPQVLTEESSRLQRRYPDWVPQANPTDWQRLGRRYLELTAQFRRERPFSTDKMPTNWRALGAIRAMLPGAHIVICRRDPLENCWSCFKQYFSEGWSFTYDIDQLVGFWKAFDHVASSWTSREPLYVREQVYEALTVHPDAQVGALLKFCGLPFDSACRDFHLARHSVRTLSAAQVREPVHKYRSIAVRYEGLLDSLRHALGLPPWTPDTGNDA